MGAETAPEEITVNFEPTAVRTVFIAGELDQRFKDGVAKAVRDTSGETQAVLSACGPDLIAVNYAEGSVSIRMANARIDSPEVHKEVDAIFTRIVNELVTRDQQ